MGFKRIIKKSIIDILPLSVKVEITHPSIEGSDLKISEYINTSFSQEGEDLLLARLIGPKTNGFYVDVGAHHPLRFSNTYKFYLQGWSGINIDPLPGCMEIFNLIRKKDINLEIAISNSRNERLTYYMFNEPALNTFDKSLAEERNNTSAYKIINEVVLETQSLASVLDTFLPNGQQIDFFSIDSEGLDLEVLKSNNWDKYRPDYILAESIVDNLQEQMESELNTFLRSKNYHLTSSLLTSVIYKKL